MQRPDVTGRPLNILLIVMHQSPFNRSIWTGFSNGFQSLGNNVSIADATNVPAPAATENLPDIVLAVHGGNVPIQTVQAYRDAGVRTAVYLLDEPYEVDRSLEWAQHYDYVFSVDQATVPVHGAHTKAAFLPLAYNSAIFSPDGPQITSRVLVLGSPFSARREYLAILRDRWGEQVTWVGPGWKEFSPAGHHYEQYVTPVDCAAFYRGAEIVINIHRDSLWSHFGELNRQQIEATHLNPRFWETAACKTLQLCSYRKDLDKFSPECPSFRNTGEFTNKLDYFINNRGARDKTAARVYSRIKEHTYQSRCETILDTIDL